jgi:GGDEF domain-containing protein
MPAAHRHFRLRPVSRNHALHGLNGNQATILVPTVSQGIAEFPIEANEIFKLIDLADNRLYIAKERGRNQVEPDAGHWDRLSNASNVSRPHRNLS